jgi:hypothetical protein
MEDIIMWIFLGGCIFFILLRIIAEIFKDSLQEAEEPKLLKFRRLNLSSSNPAQQWVGKAAKLYLDNEAMPFLEVYIRCGMSREIAYSKDHILINANTPFANDTKLSWQFLTFQNAIAKRYSLQTEILPILPVIWDDDNLNFPINENICHRLYSVKLYEEKIVSRNITYSGYRWSGGLLRAGSINYINNATTDFIIQDIGDLFITDERIIFIGKQHITKSMKISNILTYNLFRDGILIGQPNKKAILFKFNGILDFEVAMIDDGLNEFVIVLNRVMQGTERTEIKSN